MAKANPLANFSSVNLRNLGHYTPEEQEFIGRVGMLQGIIRSCRDKKQEGWNKKVFWAKQELVKLGDWKEIIAGYKKNRDRRHLEKVSAATDMKISYMQWRSNPSNEDKSKLEELFA